MLTLDSVALLQLDKFFLHLFCVCLNVVENGLVYGESLVDLGKALVQVLILVVNFVLEKSSVRVETSQLIVDDVKNLEFGPRVEEGVV